MSLSLSLSQLSSLTLSPFPLSILSERGERMGERGERVGERGGERERVKEGEGEGGEGEGEGGRG